MTDLSNRELIEMSFRYKSIVCIDTVKALVKYDLGAGPDEFVRIALDYKWTSQAIKDFAKEVGLKYTDIWKVNWEHKFVEYWENNS